MGAHPLVTKAASNKVLGKLGYMRKKKPNLKCLITPASVCRTQVTVKAR